jgi:hypothetical protein
MAAIQNLLPRQNENLEQARDRVAGRVDLPAALDMFDADRATLAARNERKYPYRKTVAVIGAILLSPLLVRSWNESQHYGYHPSQQPNTPTQSVENNSK